MNIAIVHFHLNRGGVTRVIENQLLALDRAAGGKDAHRVAILYGGRAEGWPRELAERLQSIKLELIPLPRLEYDSRPAAQPDVLYEELRSALKRLCFAPDGTLLHVHNYSLGKNCSLPGALRQLADAGFAQLLQIHDFAEDFRPANYRGIVDALDSDASPRMLYPQASHIHYAVLNRRDHSVLANAGVVPSRLHLLPNPVPALEVPADKDDARRKLQSRFGVPRDHRYVLYPVRGIRRKNVGEALLWSLLAGEATCCGMTLAPLNPVEQVHYRRWRQVAADIELPFHFETGADGGMTFAENLSAADCTLTTSVAEGFGMVFLESYLAGRRLVGRNLPAVTADFVEAGVEFDALYDTLRIPAESIEPTVFREALADACSNVLRSYGRQPLTADELERLFDAKSQGGIIDFADLNEPLQESVLRRAATDAGLRGGLLELNPVFRRTAETNPRLIEKNQDVIRRTYGLEPSGVRLGELYRHVLESPRTASGRESVSSAAVLDQFLDLTRLRLIRA